MTSTTKTSITVLLLLFSAAGLAAVAYGVQEAEAASAKIVNAHKAWQFEQSLTWDQDLRIVRSLIQSQIRIDNATDGTIYGRVTDVKGNTIGIYGKESVIMARFGYANGLDSKWQIVARPSAGSFSFDIPARYEDADYVKLWVNSNSFAIQPSAYTSKDMSEGYTQQGTRIEVNDDRIFVVHGAPPLPFVDVSSDEGDNLQHFPTHQGQIDARITSAKAWYALKG